MQLQHNMARSCTGLRSNRSAAAQPARHPCARLLHVRDDGVCKGQGGVLHYPAQLQHNRPNPALACSMCVMMALAKARAALPRHSVTAAPIRMRSTGRPAASGPWNMGGVARACVQASAERRGSCSAAPLFNLTPCIIPRQNAVAHHNTAAPPAQRKHTHSTHSTPSTRSRPHLPAH